MNTSDVFHPHDEPDFGPGPDDSPTIGPRLTRNAEGVHVPEESVPGWSLPVDPHELAIEEERIRRKLAHVMTPALLRPADPVEVAATQDAIRRAQAGAYPLTQKFTPQGDSGRFDPEPPLSAEEVLASCDHTRFGTVTRKNDGGVWVESCSGCRTTIRLALYGTEKGTAEDALRAARIVQARADQEHVEGVIRDWADRAEDYLAQENPPLPQALRPMTPDESIDRLTRRQEPAQTPEVDVKALTEAVVAEVQGHGSIVSGCGDVVRLDLGQRDLVRDAVEWTVRFLQSDGGRR